MEELKQVVRRYAAAQADHDGVVLVPAVPGLRMVCVEAPRGLTHTFYRPLVCLVLQGAKRLQAGADQRVFAAGQTLIVGADLPVASRIVQATPAEPYLALAIELQPGILGELAADLGAAKAPRPAGFRTLFVEDTNATLLDCAKRLVRLLDRPEAVPLLHEGIMRELHYWLITGPHGPALRALSEPASLARRLGQAITLLRQNYRERIPVERLAAAAGMSLTAFHRHFKQLTSLTPGQYQKRLRLVEARRLMLETGYTATRAALEWTEALTHLAQTGSIR